MHDFILYQLFKIGKTYSKNKILVFEFVDRWLKFSLSIKLPSWPSGLSSECRRIVVWSPRSGQVKYWKLSPHARAVASLINVHHLRP